MSGFRSRSRSFWAVFIGVLATVGAASIYALFFAPERIPEVVRSMQAFGSSYTLPGQNSKSIADDSDIKVLKSFSKVFVNIAKASRPALVYIRTKRKVDLSRQRNPFGFPDQFPFPFGGPPPGQGREGQRQFEEGAGSGFIVDLEKGYIVTNNHVISGADQITISTIDDREYKGKLIGGHKDSDVAVVQFEDPKAIERSTLAQVTFGDSDKVEVGDWVVALGAPFQLPQTLTVGVVSALGRGLIIGGASALEDFIQTDASINPGNSGGPLLSIDGHVIGINTAISSMSGGSAGIGFSVPANIARRVAEKLINTGKVERGFIGIQGNDANSLNEEMLKKFNLGSNQKGALVFSVVQGSPGEKAGLQPYDIIVELDGQELRNFSQLRTKVAFMAPGSVIKLVVLRSGKKMNVNLTIGSSEEFKLEGDAGTPEARSNNLTESEKFGFALTELTPQLRKSENIVAKQGVVIAEVAENGLAARFGLKAGDVVTEINRNGVKSPAEVLKAFADAEKDGKEILVLIERQRRAKLIVVSLK